MSQKNRFKKTKSFRSLTITLSFIFLLLSLVILLLTSGLETYLSFRTQQKAVFEQEKLINQATADAVNGFIQEKISSLEVAAKLDYLDPLLAEATSSDSNNPSYRSKYSMERLLSLDTAFRQLILFNSDRVELSRVSRFSKTFSTELIELDIEEVFQSLEENGQYIGSVYIDKISSEPIIIIASPVKNVFGDIEGVVVAEINLKFMWDFVSQLKVGENGYAYVVNNNGNLIAFNDVSRVLKEENLASLEKVSEFLQGRKSTPSFFSKGILGTRVVSDYISLKMPDWAVVVEVPLTEAYAGAIEQLKFTLLIILLVIVFGAGFSFYLSRVITRPVIKLKEIAEKISKGKLNIKAEIRSRDEIGSLAESFNFMTKKLLESRDSLEKKVKELSEEHGRMSSLVESVKLGVIMVDLNLKVILTNPAANKMLGKPIHRKVSFKDLSEKIKGSVDISKALSYYVHTGTPLNIQEVMIEDRYIRLFMSPVRDIIEKVFIGAVVVMEDITEQKKIDKMRTEIISITSHQLRTPTTIVKGNLEILRSKDLGKLNNQQEEIVEDTYKGNQRMIRLINDLMDAAKIDEGKFKLASKPTQLEDVVKDIVEILNPLAEERKVSLLYNYPSNSLHPVNINPERVTQIIQNIIDNALKYSSGQKNGKVEVSILEKTDSLELIVKDNGIGIPAAEQDKIFERFSRGSNSARLDPGGGSGLGLYIAKAVVEQGGGHIWFESTENKGTTFHTTYPYSREK